MPEWAIADRFEPHNAGSRHIDISAARPMLNPFEDILNAFLSN